MVKELFAEYEFPAGEIKRDVLVTEPLKRKMLVEVSEV
jgi:hypothetical protein